MCNPHIVSMTSLGLPNLVSVTIGMRIFKKKLKQRDKNELFQNFDHVHCDLEVFLHICQDVLSVQCRVPLMLHFQKQRNLAT